VLGGRKVSKRPRVRPKDGHEVRRESYEAFQDEQLLIQAALERMLHELYTRRSHHGPELVADDLTAVTTSKSNVSQHFRAATRKALAEVLMRELRDERKLVLMLDGIEVADHTVVGRTGDHGRRAEADPRPLGRGYRERSCLLLPADRPGGARLAGGGRHPGARGGRGRLTRHDRPQRGPVATGPHHACRGLPSNPGAVVARVDGTVWPTSARSTDGLYPWHDILPTACGEPCPRTDPAPCWATYWA
jgi:hypothetical protein